MIKSSVALFSGIMVIHSTPAVTGCCLATQFNHVRDINDSYQIKRMRSERHEAALRPHLNAKFGRVKLKYEVRVDNVS